MAQLCRYARFGYYVKSIDFHSRIDSWLWCRPLPIQCMFNDVNRLHVLKLAITSRRQSPAANTVGLNYYPIRWNYHGRRMLNTGTSRIRCPIIRRCRRFDIADPLNTKGWMFCCCTIPFLGECIRSQTIVWQYRSGYNFGRMRAKCCVLDFNNGESELLCGVI